MLTLGIPLNFYSVVANLLVNEILQTILWREMHFV